MKQLKQILFYLFYWTYLKIDKDKECTDCVFDGKHCFDKKHISLHVDCKGSFIKRRVDNNRKSK